MYTTNYPLKNKRMLISDEKIAVMRANVEQYERAKGIAAKIISRADAWAEWSDADLRASGKNIPRHEIEKFAYVLKPLADLYPESKHPVTDQAFHVMWKDFDQSSQQLELSDHRFRI